MEPTSSRFSGPKQDNPTNRSNRCTPRSGVTGAQGRMSVRNLMEEVSFPIGKIRNQRLRPKVGWRHRSPSHLMGRSCAGHE